MSLYARRKAVKGRKPKKNYEERFCEKEDCNIKLSIYNKKKFCYNHTTPVKRWTKQESPIQQKKKVKAFHQKAFVTNWTLVHDGYDC